MKKSYTMVLVQGAPNDCLQSNDVHFPGRWKITYNHSGTPAPADGFHLVIHSLNNACEGCTLAVAQNLREKYPFSGIILSTISPVLPKEAREIRDSDQVLTITSSLLPRNRGGWGPLLRKARSLLQLQQ